MMDQNLEYLLTRPGGMKMVTVIIGVVASILSSHSYSESPYTDYYEDELVHRNNTKLPGTELELSNMTLTFIILGVSVIYLAAHALFYVICESRLNKFIDTAFHMCGGLFLFAGGICLIYSAVQIENHGCDVFLNPSGHNGKYVSPLTTFLTVFRSSAWNYHHQISNSDDEKTCHLLGEKIVGSILNLVNSVLYAVLGFVIFMAPIEDI